MKTELNRELIEGLSKGVNSEYVEGMNNKVSSILYSAISSLGESSPYVDVNKVYLVPIDEAYTHAICSRSEYNYMLGVVNKEIEINSVGSKKFFSNLWKRLKYAWRDSHKKRSKKNVQTAPKQDKTEVKTKYDISALRADIIANIANYLSTTSIIYDFENYISIVGNDDFGNNVKINIFICLYDENNNSYKVFNYPKSKFEDISFESRDGYLSAKYETCGENYINMIKIFNSIYSNVYEEVPNQLLIESLLYNCPDSFFVDDIYETFLRVSNYIRMRDPHSFRSINDTTVELFKDEQLLKSNGQMNYQKLIALLDKYHL